MDIGSLVFIDDSFYERFKNYGLLNNKDSDEDGEHNRPCCYLFACKENENDIYWVIPVSSQVEKYKGEYKKSINKYGICDNISFGYILGKKYAFLPQNLFPVTKRYIKNLYIDKNTSTPIIMPKKLMSELNAKARKKIRYNQKGKPFGMSKPIEIYNELKQDVLVTT